MNVRRIYLVAAATLLALAMATAAGAAPRMYTGSLVIAMWGNDTTTGSVPPYDTSYYVGIPLTGQCNTRIGTYHPQETLTFPTTPTGTDTFMFTIPAYGGQVNAVDTDSDTIPDIPAGCTSVSRGDPLTGSGSINTTGTPASSRASSNPRAFNLPQSALNKVKSGASLNGYGASLWQVHFADLHNNAAVFAKSGGDGSFFVVHGDHKARQTAGAHKFGGVMKLLGSYGDNHGYSRFNTVTYVFDRNWLFNYLGAGGQATNGSGRVTAAYIQSGRNYGYTRFSGFPFSSTVYAEVFKWTTGTVAVTASQGTFPTILERSGYDSRTAMGAGVVQLVSPMLTHWNWGGAPERSTAAIGIMKIEFVPEPSSALMLGAGAGFLGLLALFGRARTRRSRESRV